MLPVAQRIFDPTEFARPATLVPKVPLKKLWKIKIKWDKMVEGRNHVVHKYILLHR